MCLYLWMSHALCIISLFVIPLFLSKQMICSIFYFQGSFAPLFRVISTLLIEQGPLEQVRIVGLIGLDDVADRQ